MKTALAFALVTAITASAIVAADLPQSSDAKPVTLMTTPGKLLLAEDFSSALPPPEGSVARFASGFKGWRFNVEKRGGHWDLVDGTFRGTENAEHNHPATASIGFDFKDVVISCQVRLHDVPLAGRRSRGFSIRTTDTKDYVCSIMLNPNGMRIQKDDNDHAGPDTAVSLGQLKTPLALGEWQTVVFRNPGRRNGGHAQRPESHRSTSAHCLGEEEHHVCLQRRGQRAQSPGLGGAAESRLGQA